MTFPAFGDFVRYLETIGELKRITAEVDPFLEITEIARRALHQGKPALLFENVKGSKYPLAINVYASEKRIEMALGCHPEKIGEKLINFFEEMMSPGISTLWKNRSVLARILRSRPAGSKKKDSQLFVEKPDLSDLPIQTCWPKDGGRFITQGQVVTYDPVDKKRNVGIYRLHVYDNSTAGMHWQIQKGGGFHHHRAEKLKKDLEVAVALGTDPALLLASVSALPEGIDEVTFASYLRGANVPMTKGAEIDIQVPARAEFILEGIVPAGERRIEGPFGDHFGHYSNAAPFPVFHLKAVTHRKNPIYPATVVGIPPMEDKFLGDASQQIISPLAKLIHKEIYDLWAYYEAGFHNLLVVSIEERYKKEAVKAALGLLGTGQLSLTKTIILVSHKTNPRNWSAVLQEIKKNFDPHFDFILLPGVPLDTLDFTSFEMELGSKMIIDAMPKEGREKQTNQDVRISDFELKTQIGNVLSDDKNILGWNLVVNSLLIVKVRNDGREIVENLVRKKEFQTLKIIAAVSEDIDIQNQESYIWGIFTRFDCARDLTFSGQRLMGISPVYSGVIGIDATWKNGYPDKLEMDPEVIEFVEKRWDTYWK